jgi:hypothetical protein
VLQSSKVLPRFPYPDRYNKMPIKQMPVYIKDYPEVFQKEWEK